MMNFKENERLPMACISSLYIGIYVGYKTSDFANGGELYSGISSLFWLAVMLWIAFLLFKAVTGKDKSSLE